MLAYDVCVDSGLLIAAAVSLTFILLLRFTAGLLLWVTILAVMLLVAYGTHWYYCYPCVIHTTATVIYTAPACS